MTCLLDQNLIFNKKCAGHTLDHVGWELKKNLPVTCETFNLSTAPLPQESIEQSCPSTDNTEKIENLSGMIQGLEKALDDIKRDISLQVRCSPSKLNKIAL